MTGWHEQPGEKWGNMMKRFFISMAVCLMLLGSGRADAMSLNVQDGDYPKQLGAQS